MSEEIFTIEVCHELDFEAMCRNGIEDWLEPERFVQRFLRESRPRRYMAHLIEFDGLSIDGAIAEATRRSLIKALPADLLAFGAKYPDKQRKTQIVAIGQSCFWDRYKVDAFLYIGGGNLRRILGLTRIPSDKPIKGPYGFLCLQEILEG